MDIQFLQNRANELTMFRKQLESQLIALGGHMDEVNHLITMHNKQQEEMLNGQTDNSATEQTPREQLCGTVAEEVPNN